MLCSNTQEKEETDWKQQQQQRRAGIHAVTIPQSKQCTHTLSIRLPLEHHGER